jgi:hypothetical protein
LKTPQSGAFFITNLAISELLEYPLGASGIYSDLLRAPMPIFDPLFPEQCHPICGRQTAASRDENHHKYATQT